MRMLVAVVLVVCGTLAAPAPASATTVFYPIAMRGLWDIDLSSTQPTGGGLVIEFQADPAGNVLPGAFTVTSLHLSFLFAGRKDFGSGVEDVAGQVEMSITNPFTGWAVAASGWVFTPITQGFLDVFVGSANVSISPLGPLLLDMTPTAANFSFLNGNPFVPGSFGGPDEVRGSFDFLFTDGLTIVAADLRFAGHEAARVVSTPEPGALLLLLGIALAALSRELPRPGGDAC